jgi:hypothetical protein
MAARAFKYPLTSTVSEVERLNTSIGVSHDGLVSSAICVNICCGWNKTESIFAKSNRRAGTEEVDSVIVIFSVKKL